jgi:hypothetical protein
VTVEPTLSVPVTVVLAVRLMIHVAVPVFSVICEAVNLITVPVSVLFPGTGVGRGLGVGVGLAVGVAVRVPVGASFFFNSVQLTRSAAPARMQI